MDIKMLTAPCGIDCFNCQIYAENITEETANRLAAALGKDPEAIACAGCRPKQGKDMLMAKDCATYQCVQDHQVEFCYECSDFPCEKLAPTKDKAERLPHNMKIYNLCAMKARGLDVWAAEAQTIRKRYFEGDMVIGCGPQIKD